MNILSYISSKSSKEIPKKTFVNEERKEFKRKKVTKKKETVKDNHRGRGYWLELAAKSRASRGNADDSAERRKVNPPITVGNIDAAHNYLLNNDDSKQISESKTCCQTQVERN